MSVQIEGKTNASQRGDLPGANEILLLIAGPTVDEKHSFQHGLRRNDRSGYSPHPNFQLNDKLSFFHGITSAYFVNGPA